MTKVVDTSLVHKRRVGSTSTLLAAVWIGMHRHSRRTVKDILYPKITRQPSVGDEPSVGDGLDASSCHLKHFNFKGVLSDSPSQIDMFFS